MEESPIHVPVFHTHTRADNSRYVPHHDHAGSGREVGQLEFLTSYFTGAPSEVGAPGSPSEAGVSVCAGVSGSPLLESVAPRRRTARV